MILSRETMTAVCNFPKVDFSVVEPEKIVAIKLRLRTLWEQLPKVTAIQGVKNFDGGMYRLEEAIIDTLNLLEDPIDEISLAQRKVDKFLAMEALDALSPATKDDFPY